MIWLVIALCVLGLFVWYFYLSDPTMYGRNLGREDFEHDVRSFLKMMDDGAILKISQRQSPVTLEFVRESGIDDQATICLRIPRSSWSERHSQELRELLDAQMYDAVFGDSADQTFSLCEVRIKVDDIWRPWAGASGARLLCLVLDALAVPRDARFDVAYVGPVGWRFREVTRKYQP